MKHSIVVPLIVLEKKYFSIIQIAELVINFYKNLSEVNPYYSSISIISEKKPLRQTIDIQDANSVQFLAEEILHKNVDDIREIDKEPDPDIYFCREGIISIGLETKVKNETLITLNYTFNVPRPSVGSIVVNELCFDTFLKAKTFLEVAAKCFPIEYSVIKISDRSLNKVARKYKAPLGWITYFSDRYEISIPNNLEGVEYEYVDEGKYLILSRMDIAINSKSLELKKQKIVELMEQIEKNNPAYLKAFIPPSV